MSELFIILISTALVNNFVLVQFLGLCPFMGVSNKLESAMGMSQATTFVLTLASAASFVVYHGLLVPLDVTYLRTISFIVVIAAVVQFTEIMVRQLSPLLHQVLGIFLPLITTNCAVLGVALLSLNRELSFFHTTLYGLGAALGFSLILVLFAAMRERLAGADIPKPFQGAAIAMVTASLMSLAFLGLSGLVQGGRQRAMNSTIDIIGILSAVAVLTGLGIGFGALLGLVSERFKREDNPLVEQIDALLPQTQCGQCGYPGCRPYAEAINQGDALNKCPPGGEATIHALADLLGRDPEPLDGEAQSEAKVAFIREAECIGCTKCIQACPVDAIIGAAKLMHTVIEDECTGCDLCLDPCPVDCIDMLPRSTPITQWQPVVAHSSNMIASDRQPASGVS